MAIAAYNALPSQSPKRVGMIRAPWSGTSVRNASGAPKYGMSASRHDPAGIALLAEPAVDEVRKRRRFGTCDLVGNQRLHQLAGPCSLSLKRGVPHIITKTK